MQNTVWSLLLLLSEQKCYVDCQKLSPIYQYKMKNGKNVLLLIFKVCPNFVKFYEIWQLVFFCDYIVIGNYSGLVDFFFSWQQYCFFVCRRGMKLRQTLVLPRGSWYNHVCQLFIFSCPFMVEWSEINKDMFTIMYDELRFGVGTKGSCKLLLTFTTTLYSNDPVLSMT